MVMKWKHSLSLAIAAMLAAQPALAGKAVRNLVLVLDGLRPDSITAEETPNLFRLRQEGVNFLNGHSVFPTVTRVNATAIGTGTYPDRNGILGNRIYIPPSIPTTRSSMTIIATSCAWTRRPAARWC